MQGCDNSHLDCRAIDGVAVIRFKAARIADSQQVTEILASLLAYLDDREGNHNVLADMSRVEFLCSEALGLFVALLKKVRQNGGEFKVCSLRPLIADLFTLTRLDRVFEIFSEEHEALASFPRAACRVEKS